MKKQYCSDGKAAMRNRQLAIIKGVSHDRSNQTGRLIVNISSRPDLKSCMALFYSTVHSYSQYQNNSLDFKICTDLQFIFVISTVKKKLKKIAVFMFHILMFHVSCSMFHVFMCEVEGTLDLVPTHIREHVRLRLSASNSASQPTAHTAEHTHTTHTHTHTQTDSQ